MVNKKMIRKEEEEQNMNKFYSLVPEKGTLELPRKVFHYSFGFVSFYLYCIGVEAFHVYPILVTILCIVSIAEFLRFNSRFFNQYYCYFLGPLMRQTEVKTKINGVIYYLLGCIIVLYGFPKDLAVLSIIYLSWVDPTASMCGRLWGKYTPKYGGKSLAGSLGAAVMGTLVTYLYFGPLARYPLSYSEASPVPLWVLTIYGGLVAAFSEGISNLLWGLDDNLTIPVISVILLWLPMVGIGLGINNEQ